MVVVCAVLLSAPLWVLLPALVAATALSMTWNGLSFTAAAELAGSARSGAALGFQRTTLSIVGVLAAPAFATLVDVPWRAGFAHSRRLARLPAGLSSAGYPSSRRRTDPTAVRARRVSSSVGSRVVSLWSASPGARNARAAGSDEL